MSRLLNRADCERKIEKKKLAEISISLTVCKCGILLGMWKQLTASNLEDGIATSI